MTSRAVVYVQTACFSEPVACAASAAAGFFRWTEHQPVDPGELAAPPRRADRTGESSLASQRNPRTRRRLCDTGR